MDHYFRCISWKFNYVMATIFERSGSLSYEIHRGKATESTSISKESTIIFFISIQGYRPKSTRIAGIPKRQPGWFETKH